MRSTKNQTIRFRVDTDTKKILDSKVSASGMTQSQFMRQLINSAEVRPMSNGKEIIRKQAMIHEDFLNYHNDIVDQVQSVKTVLENSSSMIQESSQICDKDFVQKIIIEQKEKVNSVLDVMIANYKETKQSAEESLQQCLDEANLTRRY